MHEIITLQLGQKSNYLATHFWNAQESYFTYSDSQESPVNHDVHWRPGIGADGSETFMPRTVVYDLKGGFGSLRQINSLYEMQDDQQASQGLWGGQTVVQRQPAIEPSAYQQSLDAGAEPLPLTTSTVRYWSDFNRVFLHPRSIVQLNEYDLNSTVQPFDKWASGEELFASLDKEHDILDRDLRLFAEEADQMQGIQIMASIDDAWGGFASRYLERMRDEYGKTMIWLWGLQDSFQGVPREKRLTRLANKAQTLTEAYKQASLVVPLAIPSRLPRTVALDTTSSWHTSALLATAIESATLPTRLKADPSRDTLGTITDLLNVMGKQTLAGLKMSVPQEQGEDEGDKVVVNGTSSSPRDHRDRDEDGTSSAENLHLDIDFAPADEVGSTARQNGHREPHIFGQTAVIRGEATESEMNEELDRIRVVQRRHAQQPFTRKYRTTLGYPSPDSFPRIYYQPQQPPSTSDATSNNNAPSPLRGPLRLTAALATESLVSSRLRTLRETVYRSIGSADREELSNDLAEMADEYHEGWSSGSDNGDDE